MLRERLSWVHPNALRRGEQQASGRYLHYYRHWQSFTLTMQDFRAIRWFASHNTNGEYDDPEFTAAAEKIGKDGWESLSQQEKEAFERWPLGWIAPEAQQDGVRLEGWGALEGGIGRETITSVSVENDPRWKRPGHDDSYRRTFTRLRITILSAPKEHHGRMWIDHANERLALGRDYAPDEDVLSATFYMAPDKLKALISEASASTTKPTLTIHAQGLLFRDEVDAALSELWHPREYVVVHDHGTPVVLNSISFDTGSPVESAEADEDAVEDGEIQRAGSPHLATAREGNPAAYGKHLRGVQRAIWGLAVAVVIAALIG